MPVPNLSNLVISENKQLNNMFDRIILQGSKSIKDDLLSSHECKKLEQEMLTINQIAKNLVTSQDNQAPVINLGDIVKFQVIPHLTQTFRCNVKGMGTPIKLKIEYFGEKAMDLDIFYSFNSSQPNRDNCEKLITSKPRFVYITNGQKMFNEQFAYLCFSSIKGCMLEIENMPYTSTN